LRFSAVSARCSVAPFFHRCSRKGRKGKERKEGRKGRGRSDCGRCPPAHPFSVFRLVVQVAHPPSRALCTVWNAGCGLGLRAKGASRAFVLLLRNQDVTTLCIFFLRGLSCDVMCRCRCVDFTVPLTATKMDMPWQYQYHYRHQQTTSWVRQLAIPHTHSSSPYYSRSSPLSTYAATRSYST
jgi:hypothetical protein